MQHKHLLTPEREATERSGLYQLQRNGPLTAYWVTNRSMGEWLLTGVGITEKQRHPWKGQPIRDDDTWKPQPWSSLHSLHTAWQPSYLFSGAQLVGVSSHSSYLPFLHYWGEGQLWRIVSLLPDVSSFAHSWVSWASQFLVEEIFQFWGNCWTVPEKKKKKPAEVRQCVAHLDSLHGAPEWAI